MKKLINDPERVVDEALEGMALAHPDLVEVHLSPHFLLRAGGAPPGRVGLVSGGGSGHEPLHCGFVGAGMLTAAVPGAVFTSPTPDPIQAATVAANGGAGVLHIVKNYTGDVLNFETAAELAAAEGIEVRSVVVDDDVAVKDSLYTAGRRGVGGTVLVEKIVGAAAERGDDLDSCEAVARRVVARVRSMGMALTSCTVPHAGRPTFDLPEDEMEIGIGIHGEPGRERLPVEPADRVAARLLDPVVEDLDLAPGSRVLVMTNGMGGTPLIELYILHRAVERMLADRGVQVERRLVGNYITSLEMQGASVTVLGVDDDDLLDLWDAPVCTAALRWGM